MNSSSAQQRYTLHEIIGTGSTGTVYRAFDNDNQVEVAIKKLKVNINAGQTEAVIRFRQESDIISKLSHPYIIRLSSLDTLDNNLCIVMEHFNGKNLKAAIKDLTLNEKLLIIKKCAIALQYIHENGIIHRDIKPGNILFTNNADPDIRIIDFGLAYLSNFNDVLNNGVLIGSFAYTSPEQTGILRRTIDNRSDLYSLGATFYEVLTGKPPFTDNDIGKLIHKHLALKPVPPSTHVPGLPKILDDIVLKLLQKEPEDRYHTAFSLAKDLDFFLENPAQHNFSIATSENTNKLNFQIKLTGRDKELAKLQSIHNTVKSNTLQMTLIKGASGSGKSKLIDAFKMEILDIETNFFECKCTPTTQNVPFTPIIELMDQFFSSSFNALYKNKIIKQTGEGIVYLKELFMHFRNHFPEVPGETSGSSERGIPQELMRALADFFIAISSLDKKTICVIDDIQWADNNTLEFLRYIVHCGAQSKLHIIIASRDEGLDENFVNSLDRDNSPFSTITIGPFDRDTIPLFINKILGHDNTLPELFYQLLYDNSLGYPYIILENMKALYDNGLIYNKNSRWFIDQKNLPGFSFEKNISSVLLNRLSHLPDHYLDILSIASVIGKEFDFTLLKELVSANYQDITAEKIIEIIDIAIKEQLVCEDASKGIGAYYFVHDTVTETLYNRISPHQQMALHKACANVLERFENSASDVRVFHITYHYNKTDDKEKIIQYNRLAYHVAVSNYSYKDAIFFLKNIVDISLEHNDFSREMVNFIIDLLNYLNIAARYDESFQYIDKAIAIATENNWEYETYKLNLEKGLAHYYKNDIQNAIECFSTAFEIAEKLGEEIQLPEPYLQFGGAYFFTSEFAKSEYHYNQALKYLDKSQFDTLLLAHAYRSVTLVARGLFDLATIDVRLIENDINNIIDPLTLIQLNHLVSVYYSWSMKDFTKALHYAEKNLDLANKVGNIVYTYSALSDMQHIYFYSKEYDKVIEIFEKIFEIANNTGTTIGIHYCWAYKAEAFLYCKEFDKANEIAERFLSERNEITNLHALLSFLKCRAVSQYLKHDIQSCLGTLNDACDLFQSENITAWGVFILLFKVHIYDQTGDSQNCMSAKNELNDLLKNKDLAPHQRHARELIKIIDLEREKSTKSHFHKITDKSTTTSIKEKIQLDNIIKTSQLISSILDINTLLKEIMDKILEVTGGERGVLLLYNEELDEFEYKITSNIDTKTDDFKISTSIIQQVLDTRKGIVITNVGNLPDFASSETIISQNIKSIICSPLLVQDKMIGLLYLDSKLLNNLFIEDDLELLSVFASQAAISIDNARLHAKTLERARIDQEMEIAKDIQLSIIPIIQDTEDYEIAAYMKTATEVGGDYYDLYLDNEPFFGVFGDASGHGLKSGLVMLMVEVAFNAYMMNNYTRNESLNDLYQNINATLFKNIQERLSKRSAKGHQYGYMYMTLRLFKFDRTGNFEIFGNDHAEPFISRAASDGVEIIPSSGFLVGIMEDAARKDKSFTFSLNSGDVLVLYSDGITEAIRESNSDDLDKIMFGEKRLYDLVQTNKKKTPQEIISTVIKEVEMWMTEQIDDISILIIKKK